MTQEWKTLPTLQDVAAAQAAGELIEVKGNGPDWGAWTSHYWHINWQYRSRPVPKVRKVKHCLWGNPQSLSHSTFFGPARDGLMGSAWVRIPGTEVEIEVCDG